MRALALAVALAALPAQAQPQPAPGEVLEGRFTQERIVPGLATPLRSEGRFALVPGRGLVWRVERPIVAATAITPDGVVQSIDGGAPTRLPADRVGFLGRLPLMLVAALAGDWGPLETAFTVERAGDAAAWRATLTPRAVAAPIAAIEVVGGALVDEIVIDRRDGGRDRLKFSGQTARGGAAGADDDALLAATTR